MDTMPAVCPGGSGEYDAELRARQAVLAAQLREAFPRPLAIVLEIGSGHGHFLTAFAATTASTCLGVDISRDRIERAQRKRDRARLRHLHFFRCDAGDFLACLPEHVSLEQVFILFPDPWPKRRHHKNRVVSRDMLRQLASRAATGCELFFRTDHLPYFDAVADLLREDRHWQLAPGIEWPFEEPTVFQQRAPSFASLAAILRERAGEGRPPLKTNPSR